MKTLLVDEWHTIDLPDKRVGCAEIVTSHYKKGVYLMEKVGGYDLFEVKKKIPVHSLKINDETVMVDDPLHWIGMKLIAEASFGRVFVAGLGLGLIVHHLVKNPKVTKIVVYEINSDVIALIGPHLPDDKRIEIVQGDALRHAEEKFDTYIFDLWVKRGKENSKNAPITGRILKKKEHIFLGPVFGTLTFDYHVCPYCGTGIAESLVFTKHTGPLPVDADEMLECFRESGCKVAMDSVGRIAEIDHEKVKHIFSYDELGFVKPRSEKKVM